MKKIKLILSSVVILSALFCGGGEGNKEEVTSSKTATTEAASESDAAGDSSYDPAKGRLGSLMKANVDVSKFDAALASEGQKIAEVKCTSCHKTTEEKLVGPGWKAITSRHTAHWIMNFITNPDPMIDKDPELQKQLEICMVRMSNQGLSDQDARVLLSI